MECEDKKPSFSPLEIMKMLKQIEDTLRKINKVAANLQEADKVKDSIILTQAAQNLMKLHRKLSLAIKKPKKNRGLEIPTVGI
ncbi:MAG: hypothetical protein QXR89_07885 [Candidatus Bathyarchaeia archaeon]